MCLIPYIWTGPESTPFFTMTTFPLSPMTFLPYQRIQSSQLHCIAARPPFIPYTDPVKLELDHASPKQCSFNDNVNSPIVSFHSDVFSRDYALGPPRQLLTSKFLDEAISLFNYKEVVKY